MLEMKYLDKENKYSIEFKNHSKNIVEIIGDIPVRTSGFLLSRPGKNDNWDYSNYTTIYRKTKDSVMFSNDGSEYVELIPVVSFNTNGGGTLEGEISQEAKNYEEIIVPTPIANENYEFTGWSPEIPESGEIAGNKSYTAIFTSTLPMPDPEPVPSLEDDVAALKVSVTELQGDMQALNKTLKGGNNNG